MDQLGSQRDKQIIPLLLMLNALSSSSLQAIFSSHGWDKSASSSLNLRVKPIKWKRRGETPSKACIVWSRVTWGKKSVREMWQENKTRAEKKKKKKKRLKDRQAAWLIVTCAVLSLSHVTVKRENRAGWMWLLFLSTIGYDPNLISS